MQRLRAIKPVVAVGIAYDVAEGRRGAASEL
ncbi:MAG: hypothetical protein WDN31_17650 [Hyphomicrobium sp.]